MSKRKENKGTPDQSANERYSRFGRGRLVEGMGSPEVLEVRRKLESKKPSGVEEGRRDIFVLSTVMHGVGLEPPRYYGLFQYFRARGDSTYTLRTPVRFTFPEDPADLGKLVAVHWDQITEDAGTYFLNLAKKGYFPDMHLGGSPQAAWTTYDDLLQHEYSHFESAFNAEFKRMRGGR